MLFWVGLADASGSLHVVNVYEAQLKYIFKQGWGFIKLDGPRSFPSEVAKALETQTMEAKEKAEERGREVTQGENCVYFRKPGFQT